MLALLLAAQFISGPGGPVEVQVPTPAGLDHGQMLELIDVYHERDDPAGLVSALEETGWNVQLVADFGAALEQFYERTGTWGCLEFGVRVLSRSLARLPQDATEVGDAMSESIGQLRDIIEAQPEVAAFMETVDRAMTGYEAGDYDGAIEQWTRTIESAPDLPEWRAYRMQTTVLLAEAHLQRYRSRAPAPGDDPNVDLYAARDAYESYRASLDPSDVDGLGRVDLSLWEISRLIAAELTVKELRIHRSAPLRYVGGTNAEKPMRSPETLERVGRQPTAHHYRQSTRVIWTGMLFGVGFGVAGITTIGVCRRDGVNEGVGGGILLISAAGAFFGVGIHAAVVRRKIGVDAIILDYNEEIERNESPARAELTLQPTISLSGGGLAVRGRF